MAPQTSVQSLWWWPLVPGQERVPGHTAGCHWSPPKSDNHPLFAEAWPTMATLPLVYKTPRWQPAVSHSNGQGPPSCSPEVESPADVLNTYGHLCVCLVWPWCPGTQQAAEGAGEAVAVRRVCPLCPAGNRDVAEC